MAPAPQKRACPLIALAVLLAGCATLPEEASRDCAQGHARGCSDLGDLAREKGDIAGAEHAYAQACALRNSYGCLDEGTLALQRSAPDEALAAFARACALGSYAGCQREGELGVDRGDRDAAREGLGHNCEKGDDPACVTLGRFLVDHHELELAEAPLARAQADGWGDAWPVLADLSDARGDHARADRLRWEGPAVDQPPVVIGGGLRLDSNGGPGVVFSAIAQPFALDARRIRIGALVAFGDVPTEVDASVGYQYFANEFVVPYADLLLGVVPPQHGDAGQPNVGGELGLKLSMPPLGDLSLAIGSSRTSPLHATFALDLHWLIALEAVGQLH